MKDFFFWKRWTSVNKSFFFFSLLLLTACFTLVFYYQSLGTENMASPVLENNLRRDKILLDEFERHYYQNTIEVELFLGTQDYVGGPVKNNTYVFYVFLGVLTVALSLWLASITKIINKTWYLRFWILDLLFSLTPFRKMAAKKGWLKASWYKKGIGIYGLKYFLFITVFAFGLLALNLDALNDEPSTINYWFLAFLGAIGGLSIYFYSFNTKTSIALRFFAFLVVFGGLYYAIYAYTGSLESLLHLVAFGIKPLSILAILIILYSGYRVFHFFLYMSASQKQVAGKQTLINFSIISVLYFSNALFLLLKELGYMKLEIMYLTPSVMFLLSAFLGIWSKRLKAMENQQNILVPHSLNIYLAGNIITAGLLFFSYGTYNEGLISLLERMIMYANVCVGGVFVFYIMVNFAGPLLKGFPVYNKSLHGIVFSFSGVFFIAAGIIAVTMNTHYFLERIKWKAANYSATRDYYAIKGNDPMREYYTLQSHNAGFYNLKPNYLIANSLNSFQVDSTIYHLSKISDEGTTEYVYTELAKAILAQDKDQFFDAIFALQDGLAIFPKSAILRNNLGNLYMNFLTDSSYNYLMQAQALEPDNEAVATNLLKFKAKGYDRNATLEELDSLIHLDIHPENRLYQANRIAVARLIASEDDIKFPGNLDSMKVNPDNVALLYNYLLYLETKPFEKSIADKIALKFKGDLTSETMNQLMSVYGVYQLRKGDIKEGVKALSYVVNTCYSHEKPYYANLLAKLLLQNDIDDLALEYFIESDKAQGVYRTNDAFLNRIYLLGLYDKPTAMDYLNKMVEVGDSTYQARAQELITLFTSTDLEELKNKDAAFKIKYIHFNPDKQKINEQLANSISSEKQRNTAHFELIKNSGESISSPDQLMLSGDEQLEFNYLYLKQLLDINDLKSLSKSLDLSLPYHKQGYKAFLKGKLAELDNDTAQAKGYYQQALKRQYFNPDVLLPIVNFYEYKLKNEDAAYDILLGAVDIHKNSIPLNKAYALMCIRMNYNSFALSTMADLERLMSKEEIEAFLPEVEEARAVAAKKFNNW